MSVLALSLAKKIPVGDPLAKLILLLMADRHNEDTGQCILSSTLLAQESETSRTTVFKKIEFLEKRGLVERLPQRDGEGRQTFTDFRLIFLPDIEPAKPEKSRTAKLPPENWRPDDRAIEQIRKEFPHHEIPLDYLVSEWIGYCHGNGKRYVNFNAAWANSARRYLHRRSAKPASFADARGGRSAPGGIFAAVGDLLQDTGS